ncbi:uncharacterized protein TA19100 [Theileria annulata]|uniref:Small ribosomal subunit protein mS29 n=1 Tax=Theileria annulata TaxID=5874 RepID=Q4UG99_THEAN|nr:uncharacterized protein TA19100 [Theileria annulata]CAI73890.1 hypothetical protein, conserved [Theileria annulata]|eukprot:XP_954567.1 hypothetical protein, conserved [Theileria annulata]
MSRRLANFKLPNIVTPKQRTGARRTTREKREDESQDKYTSAYSLLQTSYKISEEDYRKYGVEQGLLPPYLSNPDSFKVDSRNLYTTFDNCNIYNVGSVVKIDTNDLFSELPEGLCGDMVKDISLLPESEPLGIVNRKPAIEIISQLKQYSQDKVGSLKSRGILLDGKRGSGKSFILNHVSLWARRNGWMVIHEPNASKYSTEVGSIKRSNAGVYIQLEFARTFLERLLMKNEQHLSEIPVVKSLYGNISLDGNYLKYSKRMFDPVIEKIIQEELEILKEDSDPDELECTREKLKLWHSYRKQFRIPILSDRLQNPLNLVDIANFGVNNETFANQAVYEIFNQLKHQTKFPLLFIIDEYNECFTASEYLSIKYENTKFNGWIPSYHLTMPRLFHKFDGDHYRNGFKILATSWSRRKRKKFRPEYLGILPNEVRTVRNFSSKEFANYVLNLKNTRVIYNFPNDKINYFYMLTGIFVQIKFFQGGNGFESRRLLSKLY